MELLFYIWRNVKRNKLRSSLTILSVGFSLALMTVLIGFMAMQSHWGNVAKKYNRIVVMNFQGFSGILPVAHVDKVRAVAGVKAATPYMWYGGNYKDEQMPFAQFGTDPQAVFQVWDEFQIDPKQLAEWQKNRQGCVCDRRLAAERGWKIGERIPLKGTFYRYDLDLVLCGTFDSPVNTGSLWFNWSYLNEGLRQLNVPGVDNTGTIFAKVESADKIPQVIAKIDDYFVSSENPTRTQTEAAFAQMFTDMVGNFQALVFYIGCAVGVSLLFVTANSMAMAVRERTTEIAVLKAIGFSRGRILWMVLGEACAITTLGGLIGVALGCLVLQALHQISVQLVQLSLAEYIGIWIFQLFAIAAFIGLASGAVPSVWAAQLSVVKGLRRVA